MTNLTLISPITKLWDIIIIGGGLAGSSLAYWCSKHQLKVLLLEAGKLGEEGATAHSRGIVRVYDPDYQLMAHSIKGVECWMDLNQENPGLFSQCGLIYRIRPENENIARSRIQEFSSSAYPIELISEKQAAKRFSYLNKQAFHSSNPVIWEPRGGFVNPSQSACYFAGKAEESGAIIMEKAPVTDVVSHTNFASVNVSKGVRLNARTVVIAAGAHTPSLSQSGQIVSRTIPLSLLATSEKSSPKQCIIDEVTDSYFRPESSTHFFSGGAPYSISNSPETLQWDMHTSHKHHVNVAHRILTDEITLSGEKKGYDGYTHNYLPVASIDKNIAIFSGFSGRGAKYIPWAAKKFTFKLFAHIESNRTS
ncbi:FAD-binding oxidoreductase [Hahella sp. CR1]|uniref:NAD(P)/FAD-dependent oxidoreductase n=1 Tax=Hahella sp. CR1 TaxID=2992807 RepID=UPI00244318D3|nr:FAD-dependent oxidoreductase [Hahella sp. CR1]MDG9668716.1 FAD-binding oxidoreductase [Hahella sp. CR1]